MEQHDDSSQEHTGVRTASMLDTKRTSGLAPRGASLSSSNSYYVIVLDYKNGGPEDDLHKLVATCTSNEKVFNKTG